MQNVLIIVQIVITICLIGSILLQRTNSDGLQGISSSSMGGIMSSASSANFMNKLTYAIALAFLINCLLLSNIATRKSQESIVDKIKVETSSVNAPGHLAIAE